MSVGSYVEHLHPRDRYGKWRDVPDLPRTPIIDLRDDPRGFAAIYDGFEHGGIEAHVNGTTVDADARATTIWGTFEHDPGDGGGPITVGNFEHTLYDDDGPVITRDLIELHPDFRERGFATAFYAHEEQQALRHGVTRIELTAAMETGGYAWARAGFEFDLGPVAGPKMLWEAYAEYGKPDRKQQLREIQGHVGPQAWAAFEDKFPHDEEWPSARVRREEGIEADPDWFTSPAEIAAYGRDGPHWSEGGHDLWLGKAFLLGSGWNGVKWLRTPQEAISEADDTVRLTTLVTALHALWAAQGAVHVPPDEIAGDDDAGFWDAVERAAARIQEASAYVERLHPRERTGKWRSKLGLGRAVRAEVAARPRLPEIQRRDRPLASGMAFRRARTRPALMRETGTHGDEFMFEMATDLGYAGRPTRVPSGEVDAAVAAGGTEVWRGVSDETYAEALVTGPYYAGQGFRGSGIYVAHGEDGRTRAVSYAQAPPTRGIAAKTDRPTVQRMALHPQANVVEYEEIRGRAEAEHKRLAEKLRSPGLSEKASEEEVLAEVARDPARYAMSQGYDAIRINDAEMNVLNRTALLVDEAFEEAGTSVVRRGRAAVEAEYEEHLHPRGRGGRWIRRLAIERAFAMRDLPGQGTMRTRTTEPVESERKIKASRIKPGDDFWLEPPKGERRQRVHAQHVIQTPGNVVKVQTRRGEEVTYGPNEPVTRIDTQPGLRDALLIQAREAFAGEGQPITPRPFEYLRLVIPEGPGGGVVRYEPRAGRVPSEVLRGLPKGAQVGIGSDLRPFEREQLGIEIEPGDLVTVPAHGVTKRGRVVSVGRKNVKVEIDVRGKPRILTRLPSDLTITAKAPSEDEILSRYADWTRERLRNLTSRESGAKVAVRMNSGGLPTLLDEGRMRNAHHGSSYDDPERGTRGESYERHRAELERAWFHIDTSETADPDAYPVYGYVTTDQEDLGKTERGSFSQAVHGFGDVKLTLRDHVRERTTVTFSDSNYIAGSEHTNAVASPIDDPSELSVSHFQNLRGIEKPVYEYGDEPRPYPEFTPEERERIRRAGEAYYSNPEDAEEAREAKRMEIAEERGWRRWRHGDFIEAQIHGTVRIPEDVERIDFTTPADPEIKRRLDELGVPYFEHNLPEVVEAFEEHLHPRGRGGRWIRRMWHLAPATSTQSIKQHGLQHERGGERRVTQPGTYLWDNPEDAEKYRRFWGGRDMRLYQVETVGLDLQPDPLGVPGAFVTKETIPPEAIEPVDEHGDLVRRALWSWVGWPSDMRIHMADEIAGAPEPSSGSGKDRREQARTLLAELRERGRPNDKPLYRGASKGHEPSTELPSSWSERLAVARKWAGKDGTVETLKKGAGHGIKMGDYVESQQDDQERQWLILPDRVESEGIEDYRGLHRAPERGEESEGSSLDNPTMMFGGDDIYGPHALRYFGSGGPSPSQDPETQAWARRAQQADRESLAAIKAARGKPDHVVTIYRGVPKGVTEIQPGDWVTLSRTYAELHGESNLEAPGGGYEEPSEFEVLSRQVRAGDLYTDGDLNEWGWSPGARVESPGLELTDEEEAELAAEDEAFAKALSKLGPARPTEPVEAPNRHAEWLAALDRSVIKDVPEIPEGVTLFTSEGQNPLTHGQARRHLADLALVPEPAMEKLRGSGVEWLIGDGPVPAAPGYSYLTTEKPRGWGGGWTWKNVAGMYDQHRNKVISGVGRHGAKSLVLHETGHALARKLNLIGQSDFWVEEPEHQALIAHHKRLYRKLDSYEKQRSRGGSGNYHGRDEMAATGFEWLLKEGREATVERYDEEFVAWLEEKLS